MTIAFWCVLIAAFLPYVPFGLAQRSLDPKTPRSRVAQLQGLAARAYGAHANAFETFPSFAAAVIISSIAEGANSTVDRLACVYVVARIAHMGFYLADRQPLRSAAFFVGLLVMVAIFVHPAFRAT